MRLNLKGALRHPKCGWVLTKPQALGTRDGEGQRLTLFLNCHGLEDITQPFQLITKCSKACCSQLTTLLHRPGSCMGK